MDQTVLRALADVTTSAADDDVAAAALRAWAAVLPSDDHSLMRRTEATGVVDIWSPVDGRLADDHWLMRLFATLWATEDPASTHPNVIAFLQQGPGAYLRSALEPDCIWHERPHYQIIDKVHGNRDMVSLFMVPKPGTLVVLHAGSYGDHFPAGVVEPASIFGRVLTGLLMGRGGFGATYENRLQKLTPRETQILELVHGGLRNSDIAARLSISALTVRKHLENIFAKLGVQTRTAAAALLVMPNAEPPLRLRVAHDHPG